MSDKFQQIQFSGISRKSLEKKERQAPLVGSVFTKKYNEKLYQMEVVATKKGLRFRVLGKNWNSPSAAAKSITHRPTNGWVFWNIDKN